MEFTLSEIGVDDLPFCLHSNGRVERFVNRNIGCSNSYAYTVFLNNNFFKTEERSVAIHRNNSPMTS